MQGYACDIGHAHTRTNGKIIKLQIADAIYCDVIQHNFFSGITAENI